MTRDSRPLPTPSDALCECGHPFAPNHQTPGAECFVYGCDCSTFKSKASLFSFVRGLTLWRVSRFGNEWAVNATHLLYLSNHAYPGERRYYVRIGARPGWTRSFGRVVGG